MGQRNGKEDFLAQSKGGHHHKKNKKKHRERPCPNPPAVPKNVRVTAKAREAKNHLEFSGKVRWDGVFEDEQGHKIPGGGVEIDHYEGQWGYVDRNGDWIDTEDGDVRKHEFHKKSVKGLKIDTAKIVSGQTAEYTTKKNHNFVVGEKVRVEGCSPGAYNGRFTVTSVSSSTKFRCDIGATPRELETPGTVEGEPDPEYDFIIDHFSNPKKWRVVARVRAWDNKSCASDWSDWTDPLDVWNGSDPQPPAPTFVSMGFDRIGNKRHDAFRGKIKIAPVRFWDVPGGDEEDDLQTYHARIEVKEPGGVWERHDRKHVRDSDDEKESDDRIMMTFRGVRRRNSYRVFLSSTDRYGRTGQETGPWPDATGTQVGGNPDEVSRVDVEPRGPRRLVATWPETPTFEDVDHYLVQWWRKNPLTLVETNKSRDNKDVYRVPEADKGKTHFAKVFAVDQDGLASTEKSSLDADEEGDYGTGAGTSEVEVGDVKFWPGAIKSSWSKCVGGSPRFPNGTAKWIRCDGCLYDTAQYPDLFAEIQYRFGGSGDQFAVPDYKKRHLRGTGDSEIEGSDEGVSEDARNHNHSTHPIGTHEKHKDHRHRHGHDQHRGAVGEESGGHSHGLSVAGVNINPVSGTGVTVQAGSGQTVARENIMTHGHSGDVTGNTGEQGSRHEHDNKDESSGGIKGISLSLQDASTYGIGHDWDLHGPTDSSGNPVTIDLDSTRGHGNHNRPADDDGNDGHGNHAHSKGHYVIRALP